MAVPARLHESVVSSQPTDSAQPEAVAVAYAVALRTNDLSLLYSIHAYYNPAYDVRLLQDVRRTLDMLPPTLTESEKRALVFFSVFLRPHRGTWVSYSG